METFISRYRNVSILVAILFAQVLGLAVQVKRNTDNKPTRLLRIWTVNAVAPFEKSIVWFQNGTGYLWHDYLYLRGVRQENRDLKAQIEKLRLQEVRLKEDAEQARRLQVLLGFKEQYISQTMAAQVIGSCGSSQAQCVYIDKGLKDGMATDMAVITADGVVGKVLRVLGPTSQVLLINDQTSGVGAILDKSRLQGILRGTPTGEVVLEKVMSDEQVQPGETVLTSGGDLVFPKGMPVGVVTDVSKGSESFLNIRVKPAANLAKLEEVLVITKKEEKQPTVTDAGPVRAIDVLTQRLPSVPQKPPADANAPAASANGAASASAGPSNGTTSAPTSKLLGSISSSGSATTNAKPPVGRSATPSSGVDAATPVKKPATTTSASPDTLQGSGAVPPKQVAPSQAQKPPSSTIPANSTSTPGVAPDTTRHVGTPTPNPAQPKPKPQPPTTEPSSDDKPH